MRFPVAKALALIGGAIVNRQPGIVSDVDDPVGQPRDSLREARPGAQILLRLAGVDELGGCDRLVLVVLAGGVTSPATRERGDDQNTGKEGGQCVAEATHV